MKYYTKLVILSVFLVSILFGNMMFYCHGENTIDSTVLSEITTNMQFVATLNTNQLIGMESAVLTLTLKNNWTNDVSIGLMHKYLDCEVTVSDESGVKMPSTRRGQKLIRMARNLGSRVRKIPPQGKYIYTIPVNSLYDMTCLERYIIQARIRVFVRLGEETQYFDIESVPVNITVLRQN